MGRNENRVLPHGLLTELCRPQIAALQRHSARCLKSGRKFTLETDDKIFLVPPLVEVFWGSSRLQLFLGSEALMAILRYAEELRSIGQALQAAGVTSFELHSAKAGYFIKDLAEPPFSLRNWMRQRLKKNSATATYGFDLSHVEELSNAGRARRSNAGQLTNFRDLSNLLRTIGEYMDSKEVELIELQKTPMSVLLVYRDKLGNEVREDRSMAGFYSVFREILMNRS
jgi:hypothetical protein